MGYLRHSCLRTVNYGLGKGQVPRNNDLDFYKALTPVSDRSFQYIPGERHDIYVLFVL